MKFRELHLGKAISAALFVLLLTVAGTKNALAQTQVATLEHQGNISAFYGPNSLAEAYEAAEHGDIITLSSGSFTPITIDKAITLRGAGCVADTDAGTAATVINGAITMKVTDTVDYLLNVEGILFPNQVNLGPLTSPTFTRCNFMYVTDNNVQMHDGQFIDCIIKKMSFYRFYNTTMVNCVVWEPEYNYSNQPVVLYNSIYGGMVNGSLAGVTAYNSIIIHQRGGTPGTTNNYFNCLGINADSFNAFGFGYTSACDTVSTYEDVFLNFDGNFTLESDFSLTGTATTFETTDGTQVGIYGGSMPYSSRPAYQVLKHTTVAPRSTVDGKLEVEIEVITEEE